MAAQLATLDARKHVVYARRRRIVVSCRVPWGLTDVDGLDLTWWHKGRSVTESGLE